MNRRTLLHNALAPMALGSVAGLEFGPALGHSLGTGSRPAFPLSRPAFPPSLKSAAIELGSAIDELLRVSAVFEGLIAERHYKANDATKAYEEQTVDPAIARVEAAEKAFLALLRSHETGAVSVRGRIYADVAGPADMMAGCQQHLLRCTTVIDLSRVVSLD